MTNHSSREHEHNLTCPAYHHGQCLLVKEVKTPIKPPEQQLPLGQELREKLLGFFKIFRGESWWDEIFSKNNNFKTHFELGGFPELFYSILVYLLVLP